MHALRERVNWIDSCFRWGLPHIQFNTSLVNACDSEINYFALPTFATLVILSMPILKKCGGINDRIEFCEALLERRKNIFTSIVDAASLRQRRSRINVSLQEGFEDDRLASC